VSHGGWKNYHQTKRELYLLNMSSASSFFLKGHLNNTGFHQYNFISIVLYPINKLFLSVSKREFKYKELAH